MTLSKKYDEVMAHIEVTDEMKSRILDNLRKADAAPKQKVINFYVIRKYLPVAACLALLLIGAFAVSRVIPASHDNQVLAPADIENVASAKELSDKVGFEVYDISGLPFEAEQTEYTAYWQEMAQVTYTGKGQTITYRKSAGTGDNSGDYTAYDNCVNVEVNGITIQLKGDGETFRLALWSNGGYAYSIQSDNGLDEAAFVEMISSLR